MPYGFNDDKSKYDLPDALTEEHEQLLVDVAGKADAKHTHSASDITSGTLPIANGGTGSTSAADACNAIGAVSTSGYDNGGDLNNATMPGFYTYYNTTKNAPVGSLGVVYVCRRGDYISQLAVNNFNESDGGRIWVRSKTNAGAWTAWERVVNNASAVAIYSVYNAYDKDHFLTPSVSEYNSLILAGWTGDGIKFYAITK